MIFIKPVYTLYEREKYSSACGFSLSDDENCVASFENDKFTGCALYKIDKNGIAEITNIGFINGYYDETSRILLIKDTLNCIDLKGSKDVEFKGLDIDLAKQVGFSEIDGVLKVNLDGYFAEPCKKCKNN